MNIKNIFAALLFVTIGLTFAQGEKYPVEDFYNRTIELPVDYNNPGSGTFFLYYQITSNFDFSRPTLFYFYDSQQEACLPGKVDELAKRNGFFEDFNVVWYQYRGRKYSYIELKNNDGSVNWEKSYYALSSSQAIEDIERIRLNLFTDKPDTKIFLYGRSGGGYLELEYLSKYSQYVKRAFISVPPHPIIMQKIGHLESTYLHETLTSVNPELYKKLEIVLEKNIVPNYNLLWILKGIPYASQNPKDELTKLINELFEGKKELYENYLGRKGFDFSKLIPTEKMMSSWEMGLYLRPLECDTEYMLNPEPEFIDPLYLCLRKGAEPYIRLIQSKKVKAPVNPSMESFSKVETEIFCLFGKHDHVSPYQIGIEFKKYFRNYDLFIADDNHNLNICKECYPQLTVAFLKYGIGSKELNDAKSSVKCKEWNPM